MKETEIFWLQARGQSYKTFTSVSYSCSWINGAATLSITTFSITTQHNNKWNVTFSIMTLSTMALVLLCWVSQISCLCWMSLCWVSLCWMSWRRINSAATLGINEHAIYETQENIITVMLSVIMLNVVVVTVVAPNKHKWPQHAVSFYSSVIYNCNFLLHWPLLPFFPRKKSFVWSSLVIVFCSNCKMINRAIITLAFPLPPSMSRSKEKRLQLIGTYTLLVLALQSSVSSVTHTIHILRS